MVLFSLALKMKTENQTVEAICNRRAGRQRRQRFDGHWARSTTRKQDHNKENQGDIEKTKERERQPLRFLAPALRDDIGGVVVEEGGWWRCDFGRELLLACSQILGSGGKT